MDRCGFEKFCLVLARLVLGAMFVVFGWQKVSGTEAFGSQKFTQFFPAYVQTQLASDKAFPFARAMLTDHVAKKPNIFAHAVAIGELALGACLLLGFLTRVASFGGILLVASIGLTSGYTADKGLATQFAAILEYVALALLFIVFVVTGPGRWLGLDGVIFGRREG